MKNITKILIFLAMLSQFIQCDLGTWKLGHKNFVSTEKSITSTEENPTSDQDNPNLDDIIASSPGDRPVSRTSGVAPLAVHFFSDFVDSATGEERIDRYHHYDYTWNFGDAASGKWNTSGKSKNIAKGANAAHIFENAGTYNVTLTIRNHSGVVGTENYTVTVTDPDSFYEGTYTICVNNAGDTDFSGAPEGAWKISTNNLSAIVQYAVAGNRILFKRGSTWTTAGLVWPANSGPVTIGAYGTGTNPDTLGIYNNAPRIIVTGDTFLPLDQKQDWRIMDLHLIDTTRNYFSLEGTTSMQRLLILRMKIEGFMNGINISHYNDNDCMQNDDIVIASCDISDSYMADIYTGSERLAIMGNIVHDNVRSHVIRVWQAYRSVVAHNFISGSCVNSDLGQGALKFHGPGTYPEGGGIGSLGTPVPNTNYIGVETQFSIISDNVFGRSGPWPVGIGPQNTLADERLTNIIVERNRFHADYGSASLRPVTVHLNVWARYCTVRNNIFDGTGTGDSYRAIVVDDRGVVPPQTNIEIYNNTIYRGDSASSTHIGITIWEEVTDSIARNNLISFPYATGVVTLIYNESSDLIASNNLLTDNAYFVSPNAINPLDRNFQLQAGSPALSQGFAVPVFDDYFINTRPATSNDLGALEQ